MNKKVILLVLVLILSVVILSSCGNRQVGIDTIQTFNKAYIKLGDEWKFINIISWRDFKDSDDVQVTTSDGTTYLTHYSNMILVSGK